MKTIFDDIIKKVKKLLACFFCKPTHLKHDIKDYEFSEKDVTSVADDKVLNSNKNACSDEESTPLASPNPPPLAEKQPSSENASNSTNADIDYNEILQSITSSRLDDKTVNFLKDRLAALSIIDKHSQDDMIAWSSEAVDFIDELKLLSENLTDEEINILNDIVAKIRCQIVSFGGEIIDSDTWKPELQRAISVMPNIQNEQITIVGKGASGLLFKGELIRKQEVRIEKPLQNEGDLKWQTQ